MTPPVAHVDAKAWRSVQPELEAIASVERALLDDAGDRIWIVAEAGAEEVPLEVAVHEALRAGGIDPASLSVQIVSRPGRGTRQRVRLVDVNRTVVGERRVQVRVLLEWQGREHAGEADGEAGMAIELRTAGTATLNALRSIVGDMFDIRLVGIKELRAFDTDLMIAALWSPGPPPRRCVGAVLDTGDAARTAAMAVLHGLNRTIGNFLAAE